MLPHYIAKISKCSLYHMSSYTKKIYEQVAKKRGIKYSGLNKPELVELVNDDTIREVAQTNIAFNMRKHALVTSTLSMCYVFESKKALVTQAIVPQLIGQKLITNVMLYWLKKTELNDVYAMTFDKYEEKDGLITKIVGTRTMPGDSVFIWNEKHNVFIREEKVGEEAYVTNEVLGLSVIERGQKITSMSEETATAYMPMRLKHYTNVGVEKTNKLLLRYYVAHAFIGQQVILQLYNVKLNESSYVICTFKGIQRKGDYFELITDLPSIRFVQKITDHCQNWFHLSDLPSVTSNVYALVVPKKQTSPKSKQPSK
jgi:hypothetical protein